MGVKVNWSPRIIGDSQKIYRSEQPFDADSLPSILETLDADTSVYDDTTATAGVNYYYAIETIDGARTILSKVVSVISGPTVAPLPPSVPVVESYQSNSGVASALVATKPTGVIAGDLLIIFAGNDWPGASQEFLDNMSGWTLATNGGDTFMDCYMGVYWRIADGTEGATENVPSNNSTYDWITHYIRISGAHATTPVHKAASKIGATGATTEAVPAVTTTVDNCLLIIGIMHDGEDGLPFTVNGTDYSLTDELGVNGAAGAGAGWGQKDQPTAGATTAASFTCSTADGAVTFQLAIAPPV